jgi:hypothetical protein
MMLINSRFISYDLEPATILDMWKLLLGTPHPRTVRSSTPSCPRKDLWVTVRISRQEFLNFSPMTANKLATSIP